jgi:hypothetical protein
VNKRLSEYKNQIDDAKEVCRKWMLFEQLTNFMILITIVASFISGI